MKVMETGLSEDEVQAQRERFGKNDLKWNEVPAFYRMVWNVVREPMFIGCS